MIKNILSKPFPAPAEPRQRFSASISFGLFVGVFLFVFTPFGLHGDALSLALICAGYGLITAAGMLTMQFPLIKLFPNFYRDDGWTIGKEVLQTMGNVLLIAAGNALYSAWLGFYAFSAGLFLLFLGITLAVGFFPVTIMALIKQNGLDKKYRSQSAGINESISHHNDAALAPKHAELAFCDEELRPVLTTFTQRLVAIESADNYIKIYWKEGSSAQTLMVRNTMTYAEEMLKLYPGFFRTHRSWIVNTSKIKGVEGNARGYTLRLDGINKDVPVARRRIEAFDAMLNTEP